LSCAAQLLYCVIKAQFRTRPNCKALAITQHSFKSISTPRY
jgi:hypothetical protein